MRFSLTLSSSIFHPQSSLNFVAETDEQQFVVNHHFKVDKQGQVPMPSNSFLSKPISDSQLLHLFQNSRYLQALFTNEAKRGLSRQ